MVFHGKVFLGKDKKTYGEEGTGWADYDPDFECGGKEGTPGRQCAFKTTTDHTEGLSVSGVEGRNLHVNIASYRDPLCPRTLYNMYTKAKRPENLHVRVLQQNDPEVDVNCGDAYCERITKEKGLPIEQCPFRDQIYIHHIHAKEAAGPTWARGLLSKDIEQAYLKNELKLQDFCMSTDSHMDFEPEWDEKIAIMWEDAENEYAVLSTYVQDIEHLGEDTDGKPHHQVPHLCMIKFTSNVRTHATKCANDLSKPKLTNAVWGAGLSYSKCHAELKVQVDPHTPHIFDGEEFNRAARFWTYGYDIYTPNHVYVLHDYHGSQSNPVTRGWGKNPKIHGTFEDSNKRLRTMLDMPGGESDPDVAKKLQRSKYGLGDRRSLDKLIQFTGFDLRHQKVSIDGKNRCGNLQWVPFEEHPKGVNYIPGFDSETEYPIDLTYESTSVWYSQDRKSGETAVEDNKTAEENKIPGDAKLEKKHADLAATIDAVEKGEKEIMDEGEHPISRDLDKMHEALSQKIGALRGVGKKAKEKVKAVKSYIHEHPLITPEQVHGFQELPLFVQCNVFILLFGLFFFIWRSKGTGRAFKRDTTKKA